MSWHLIEQLEQTARLRLPLEVTATKYGFIDQQDIDSIPAFVKPPWQAGPKPLMQSKDEAKEYVQKVASDYHSIVFYTDGSVRYGLAGLGVYTPPPFTVQPPGLSYNGSGPTCGSDTTRTRSNSISRGGHCLRPDLWDTTWANLLLYHDRQREGTTHSPKTRQAQNRTTTTSLWSTQDSRATAAQNLVQLGSKPFRCMRQRSSTRFSTLGHGIGAHPDQQGNHVERKPKVVGMLLRTKACTFPVVRCGETPERARHSTSGAACPQNL